MLFSSSGDRLTLHEIGQKKNIVRTWIKKIKIRDAQPSTDVSEPKLCIFHEYEENDFRIAIVGYNQYKFLQNTF